MANRIVYLSWPTREISGGIKMAFRHVETLGDQGLESVVATEDGESPSWFHVRGKVIPLQEVQKATDILVFPENNLGFFEHFEQWPNRKVVFCQCQHMVFRGLGQRQSYRDYGVSDILCPGFTSASFCQNRFPELNVHVIPNYVDAEVFRPAPAKVRQIAFVPKKRPREAEVIRDLFRAKHPGFRDMSWQPIAGMTEAEVAQALGASTLFLSLCRLEACPLILLEAMACGCVVAGFDGIGGRDYATARNGFWAPEDDCVAGVAQLAAAAECVERNDALYKDLLEEGTRTVAHYSREQFAKRLIRFWERFMEK